MIRLNIVNPVVLALLMLLMTVFFLPLASADLAIFSYDIGDRLGPTETENASGQTLRLTGGGFIITADIVHQGYTVDCISHTERWDEYLISLGGEGTWEIISSDRSEFGRGTWKAPALNSGISFRDDGGPPDNHDHGGLLEFTVMFTKTSGQPFPGGPLQTMTIYIPFAAGEFDSFCNALLVGDFNDQVRGEYRFQLHAAHHRR